MTENEKNTDFGEIGEVVNVLDNGRLTVKLMRQEACAKCKACTVGLEEKDMFLEAENKCDAKKGEFVQVFLEKSSFLKAVLIMYTIPLIVFMVSVMVTYLMMKNEGISVVVGAVALAVTYIIIRKNDYRFSNEKYRPVAIKKAMLDE